MKTILLIGLGRFGRHIAAKLQQLGHEVLAIDSSEERVNAALPLVTNAQIGDSTDPRFIASLGVNNFDLCVVAIGDNFQNSLETTALLKEMGAPFVVSRATREVHEKFLLRNGADKVVYPERQTAEWAAVCYSDERIFDYMELPGDFRIYQTSIPTQWIGKTVVDLKVREKYHLNLLVVNHGHDILPVSPAHHFAAGETVYLLGSEENVQKFLKEI